MISKIIAFMAIDTIEKISISISVIALVFSFYAFYVSRKDKLYVAKLSMRLVTKNVSQGTDSRGQAKYVVKPHFEVKVVNQGQVTIYPESIEIIEKHTKETSTVICQSIEPVYDSGRIPKPVVHDDVILPGKNNYYQVLFPDSLINSNIPLSSMRFDVKLTLENEKEYFLKKIAISKNSLTEVQKQRDKSQQY